MGWTKKEFERVVANTRLADKTVAACQDVLVSGKSGAEAAQIHGVLAPHISRGLKVLREKREELRAMDRENAEALGLMEVSGGIVSVLKGAAREAAQSIKGDKWIVRDSEPGHIYEGAGVVKVGGFFVQDVGRVGVLHDMKNLDVEPVLGRRLEIAYATDGKGSVKDVPIERGTREKGR